MKRTLWIIFMFTMLQVSYAQTITSDMRAPNNYEEFYNKIAIENNIADLCAKISPKAYSKVGSSMMDPFGNLLILGDRMWYKRSECYFMVAQQTMDDTLCNNIRSLGLNVNRSKYSKQECLDNVAQRKKIINTPGQMDSSMTVRVVLSKDFLIHIFSEMGYSENSMPDRYKKEVYGTQDALSYNPQNGIDDLIARVQKLPNFD